MKSEHAHVISLSAHSIFFCLNLYLLIQELRKIANKNARYQTSSLKWLCIGALLSAVLCLLLYIIQLYILYFENSFSIHLYILLTADMIAGSQVVLVALYQLRRLYLLFPKGTEFGGYPKWVFIIISAIIIVDYFSLMIILSVFLHSPVASASAAPYVAVCVAIDIMVETLTL